jgi:hypothetical protein
LATLIIPPLVLWAVSAYPAFEWWGGSALVYSAVALLLCLAPAAGTLLWSDLMSGRSPEQRLLSVLGGSGVRMTVVLGAGLALHVFVPFFERTSFWVWVLVYYLLTLALEILLLAQSRQPNSVSVSAEDRSESGMAVS